MATLTDLISTLNSALAVDAEDRGSLRNYFLQGDIPIQDHFHAFINSGPNLMDDGLFKTTDTPLCILAPSGDAARPVLHLYGDDTSEPLWELGIRGDDLHFVTPADSTPRLTIGTNGNVGIGTSSPATSLQVATGTPASLAANSGYLIVGPSSYPHLALDANQVQAKSNGTTVAALYLNRWGGNVSLGGISSNVYTYGKIGIDTSSPATSLQVATGSDVDLTPNSGYVIIGNHDATHLAFDDNEIQAKYNGTTAGTLLLNNEGGDVRLGNSSSNVYTYGKIGIYTASPATSLHVASGTEASLSANSGYLIIGSSTAAHLAFDTNEIQAKGSGTTVNTLSLNPAGGNIQLGNSPYNVYTSGKIGIGTTLPATSLQVATGTEASLAANSGYLIIGSSTAAHLAFDTNEIQAKGSGTTVNTLSLNPAGGNVQLGNSSSSVYTFGKIGIGTTLPATSLQVASGTEASLSANSGYLIIGSSTTAHLAFDTNEIQAKSNGTTASTLHLNYHGGNVDLGDSSSNVRLGGSSSNVYTFGKIGIYTNSPATSLQVAGGTSVALAADRGYLIVGSSTSSHLAFDTNEIQAKSDGTTAGTLFLNYYGGNVQLGGSSSNVYTYGKIGIDTSSPATSLHVYSGTSVALTADRGYLIVGSSTSSHLAFDTNRIQAKSNVATTSTLYLNYYGGTVYVGNSGSTVRLGDSSSNVYTFGKIGIDTTAPATSLHVAGGSDVDLTGNSGYVIIGSSTSSHLAFDNNEIMAKLNGTTAATLHLNWEGGQVYVGSGGLYSPGSKSFLIDHPLDPENKTLRHYAVESPEILCLYRGKVSIGKSGQKQVKLPDYFTALTKAEEATVTLTPIGKGIKTLSYEWKEDFTAFNVYGAPESEVSYMVLADRNDPAMVYNRKPVEEAKGGDNFEKGTYISAKEYEQAVKDKLPRVMGLSRLEADKLAPDYFAKRKFKPHKLQPVPAEEEELEKPARSVLPEEETESEKPSQPEPPREEKGDKK